jgi:hypothetical protein
MSGQLRRFSGMVPEMDFVFVRIWGGPPEGWSVFPLESAEAQVAPVEQEFLRMPQVRVDGRKWNFRLFFGRPVR